MCNLDARHHQQQKADLQSIVKDNCKHLSANCQRSYCSFFIYYESPFDGTLDDWKNKLVSFQWGGWTYTMAKLSQCQRYTRHPHQKGWRLCILGILKQQQASNWALPSFIVPNKTKPNDFLEILGKNKRLVRKPLPIPKSKHGIAWVNKFYATAPNLNLGY